MTSTTTPPIAYGQGSASSDGNDDSGSPMEQVQQARKKIGTQVTSRLTEQTDQRTTQVGEQVTSIASALRETSDKLRDSSAGAAPAKALDTVTEQVEHFGSYLTNIDAKQLMHDLDDMARKRPWAVAAAMFGVGMAASRVLGASSRDRYETTKATRGVEYGGYRQYPTTTTPPAVGVTGTAPAVGATATPATGGRAGSGSAGYVQR